MWKILTNRAKTENEAHIANLIVRLHSRHTVTVDNNLKFDVNKGVLQGSVLTPHLFNMYLDHCVFQCANLTHAVASDKL